MMNRWPAIVGLLIWLLVEWAAGTPPVTAGGGAPAAAPTCGVAAPPALSLDEALKKAQVDGKYRMLLRQIKVPQDAETYAEFHDYGLWEGTEWAGFTDLPKGNWVYVFPYWYIWRDLVAAPVPARSWGPEQATGMPDTQGAGDLPTAWASRTADGEDEWLLMEYPEPVVPTAVLIHETYNPGAVVRVTAFRLDGEEVELWKGKDPTPPGNDSGVSRIPANVDFRTARIKIYLDSRQVPGWNEIDAVGLVDGNGTTHWANAAEASSTYAQPAPPPTDQDRLQRLEEEVRQLKAALEELRKAVRKP
jgi:hypothetical protein